MGACEDLIKGLEDASLPDLERLKENSVEKLIEASINIQTLKERMDKLTLDLYGAVEKIGDKVEKLGGKVESIHEKMHQDKTEIISWIHKSETNLKDVEGKLKAKIAGISVGIASLTSTVVTFLADKLH